MSNLNHPHLPRHSERESERQPKRPEMPDLYMPAMPPLGLIHDVENLVRALVRRWRFRRRFLPLLNHDDHILEDMGHVREEILWAARLPLREDATRALLERRKKRQCAVSLRHRR